MGSLWKRSEARRWVGARSLLSLGVLLGIGAGLSLVPLLSGCAPETRYRVLSTVFDGVPPPGSPPPERRRRRGIPEEALPDPESEMAVEGQTLEELQAETEPEGPAEYATYEALLAALPKDSMGNLDWVAAASQGLIQPRPGIDPEAPELPLLPYDVRFDSPIPQLQVVFPHEAHTYWLRCDNCHPQIFQMKAGSSLITMEKIFQGEYCGRCHGKVAFPPETGCARCHVKMGVPAG